jgi:hypothetical protein
MNQSRTPPLDAIDLRADSYSPDGKNIVISLAIKGASERRTYSLPVASLYAFIADLQKLKSSAITQPTTSSPPSSVAPAPTAAAATTPDSNRINIAVPNKWMLGSGLPDHAYVIMVFDPQTPKQSGFALTAGSAREMAVGLVKYADILANHEAGKSIQG